MSSFVSTPTGSLSTPTGPGFNPLGLLFGMFGAAGGTSYSGTQADWMAKQVGRLGPSLQEWFRSIPTPTGTPPELTQPSTSGVFYGFPKWIEQRFVEAGGQLPTGDPTQNSWWMKFLENPLNIITGPFYSVFAHPWEGTAPPYPAEGTGETPTEGTSPPQGTPESPTEGTGEGTEPYYQGPSIYSQVNDVIDNPGLTRDQKLAALLGLGVSGTAAAVLLGSPNYTATGTTQTPPPETLEVMPIPPIIPPTTPYDPFGLAQQYPLTPTTTPTLPSWGPGGYFNFTPPIVPPVTPPAMPIPTTAPPELPYDPTKQPNPFPPPIAPPYEDVTSTVSYPTGGLDVSGLGNLIGGLGSAMAGGGGAGPPGMTAPVVGGGTIQSHFSTPFAVAPAPPSLMQFIRALAKGGLF